MKENGIGGENTRNKKIRIPNLKKSNGETIYVFRRTAQNLIKMWLTLSSVIIVTNTVERYNMEFFGGKII